ncbi:hypothetical protein BGZ63DRAFT_461713 [Mariannaea sp. PMI_226]|nr:hypothetical protein BGZ63DRAFT_461713 [Mariannaea sp. PMI_226]
MALGIEKENEYCFKRIKELVECLDGKWEGQNDGRAKGCPCSGRLALHVDVSSLIEGPRLSVWSREPHQICDLEITKVCSSAAEGTGTREQGKRLLVYVNNPLSSMQVSNPITLVMSKKHGRILNRKKKKQKNMLYAVYVDRTHDLQIFSLTLSVSEASFEFKTWHHMDIVPEDSMVLNESN